MDFLTTEQILADRAERKKSGLIGCVDGTDMPFNSLSGISWRPADPMNPSCFCHDCRSLWDKTGEIDLELIKKGNKRALFTYAKIVPSRKDILRDLRVKTDDALEEFVKVHVELSNKTKEVENAQKNYDHNLQTHRDMFKNASYDVLKRFEKEMDEMDLELVIWREKVLQLDDEKRKLETACEKTADNLMAARKTERDFIDENF